MRLIFGSHGDGHSYLENFISHSASIFISDPLFLYHLYSQLRARGKKFEGRIYASQPVAIIGRMSLLSSWPNDISGVAAFCDNILPVVFSEVINLDLGFKVEL